MKFDLFFSDDLEKPLSSNKKYRIREYGIDKSVGHHSEESFDIPFKKDHHKKSFGKTLIIGGDTGYLGSILLAGTSALRTGSRYVEILTIDDHSKQLQFNRPELIVKNSIDLDNIINNYTSLIIGPGMSKNPWSLSIFKGVFEILKKDSCTLPIIADAGFLILLSDKVLTRQNWILTPHPGEAAKMLDCSVSSIEDNRIDSAISLKEKYGGAVLLKGNKSIVVIGNDVYVCRHGNQSMGTAGMGDCLTGVLSSFISMLRSGINYQAVLYAIALHSYSADLLSSRKGTIGILATDVISKMNSIINENEI